MKKIRKINYSEVELVLSMLIFGIVLVPLVLELLSPTLGGQPKEYVYSSLIPRFAEWFIVLGSFYCLNSYIFPKLWLDNKRSGAIIGLVLLFILNVGVFSFAKFNNQRWHTENYGHQAIAFSTALKSGFIISIISLFVYGIYAVLKAYILKEFNTGEKGNELHRGRIFRQIIIALAGYIFIVVLMLLSGGAVFSRLAPYVFQLLPFLIVIYFLSLYWLIPLYQKDKKLNVFGYGLALLIMLILLGGRFISFLMLNGYTISALAISGIFFLISIVLPWVVYYNYEASDRILFQYKAAQEQSAAELESLRLQINPHFLFNTLNTLCGIAVTEGADLTHSGIQKLGEMMRFMLHENNLDLVPLSSEIHYLKNYVDLQGLRISKSENVEIIVNIQDYAGALKIAPMMLIPLIENAYKHGISYRKKSFVNIKLAVENGTLSLEVHNSLHPKALSSVEEQRSGIGLDNVKQRLKLLYGNSYGLLISSDEEFRVKLTLNLF